MDNRLNLIAFLSVLLAIVILSLGSSILPLAMVESAKQAIMGLIGVIGTFRPRSADSSTLSVPTTTTTTIAATEGKL